MWAISFRRFCHKQHPGFEDEKKPNHVYKLKEALYGLK
jgi:hypothetical protein